MIKLIDKLIYYNANSRDKNSGDCVVRAISLAYDQDYNSTRAELNKMKRDKGFSSYRNNQLWRQYIQNHEGDSYEEKKPSPNTTVGEFADSYNGTVIVLCKDPDSKIKSTHLVTIINHDIYDSWDSSDWIVESYWQINDNASANPDMDIASYKDKIDSSIRDNIDKYNKKYKLDGSIRNDKIQIYKPATPYEMKADLYYGITYGDDFHNTHKDFRFNIPYKLSPRDTKNDQIIENVSLSWIRWYLRNIRKEIDEYNENAELHSQYDDLFTGDESLRKKLPYWCRKLITDIDDNEDGLYRYVVLMQPLPGDPTRGEVGFYADTWKELLQQIEYYKDDYSRYNRDY